MKALYNINCLEYGKTIRLTDYQYVIRKNNHGHGRQVCPYYETVIVDNYNCDR